MDINKLDYQKLVIYGVLLLIGVYFMRDMLDLNFKIPILESFEGQEGQEGQEATVGQPPAGQQVQAGAEDELEDELEGELEVD